MNVRIATLALSIFVGLVAIQQCVARQSASIDPADLDTLEHLLVDNVGWGINENMDFVKKVYAEKMNGKKDSFVQALEKLIALETIASPDKCNHEAYELLADLDEGTLGRSRNRDAVRRVDKLVQYFAWKHGEVCQDIYPKLVSEAKQSVHPKDIGYVEMIAQTVHSTWTTLSKCGQLDPDNEANMFNRFPIRAVIEKVAAGDADSKFLDAVQGEGRRDAKQRESKLKELFNKYFYEPCKQFDAKVGQKYFEAIRFDFNFHFYIRSPLDCSNTYFDRYAMGICQRLVSDKELRKSLLSELLRTN